jgi:hypothetical protein
MTGRHLTFEAEALLRSAETNLNGNLAAPKTTLINSGAAVERFRMVMSDDDSDVCARLYFEMAQEHAANPRLPRVFHFEAK